MFHRRADPRILPMGREIDEGGMAMFDPIGGHEEVVGSCGVEGGARLPIEQRPHGGWGHGHAMREGRGGWGSRWGAGGNGGRDGGDGFVLIG